MWSVNAPRDKWDELPLSIVRYIDDFRNHLETKHFAAIGVSGDV